MPDPTGNTRKEPSLRHSQHLVGLRVAMWAILLAALINIISTVGLSPLQRELTVNPSHSVTDLAYFHPVHAARYGIYVDLRDLAPGSTIILPPNHILDVPALESISHASVHIEDYDATLLRTPAPRRSTTDQVGVFEGANQHSGVFAYYALGSDVIGAERLRLWMVGNTIMILPDGTSEADL